MSVRVLRWTVPWCSPSLGACVSHVPWRQEGGQLPCRENHRESVCAAVCEVGREGEKGLNTQTLISSDAYP
jgi:hypothetical protein